ncbi:MAG: orotidine-5'-phosphate decarboxylase [bacterium]
MSQFIERLAASWRERNSLLCIGLDPIADDLPRSVRDARAPLFAFNRAIIDATAPWACAFKPQFACYGAVAAEAQLRQTIEYIHAHHPEVPVILDAKRGDIADTAKFYAREAFARYDADAITVSPYLGGDSLAPFLAYRDRHGADKGVFVLCRTSNPGSGDLQQLQCGARTVAQQVAALAAGEWNRGGNVGLVVGATWPRELGAVREMVGDMPLLVPGVGAQGGDLAAALDHGLRADGAGVLINASRSILHASRDDDFAEAAAAAAEALCARINRHRSRNDSEK